MQVFAEELTPEELARKTQKEETRLVALAINRARNNGETRCEFCRKQLPESEVQYSYLLAKSRGGEFTEKNIAVSCIDCCHQRRGRTPLEWLNSLKEKIADIHRKRGAILRKISRQRHEMENLERGLPELDILSQRLTRTLVQSPHLMDVEAPKEASAA